MKLMSWLWITAKNPQFSYSLFSWHNNPGGCFGLFMIDYLKYSGVTNCKMCNTGAGILKLSFVGDGVITRT